MIGMSSHHPNDTNPLRSFHSPKTIVLDTRGIRTFEIDSGVYLENDDTQYPFDNDQIEHKSKTSAGTAVSDSGRLYSTVGTKRNHSSPERNQLEKPKSGPKRCKSTQESNSVPRSATPKSNKQGSSKVP